MHDDVSATALVLDDGSSQVAIVALDLLTISEHTVDAVRRLLAPIEVVLCCSHTHSGPIAYADERSSRRNRGFVAVLVDRIVAAVHDAAVNLVPARIDFGESVAEVGVNRRERDPDGRIGIGRNPDGACDRSVQVVGVWGDDGESSPHRLATLVNHACHGTTLGPSNLLVSADWIGSMRDRVEAELGGLVLFLQGAGANINPDVGWDVASPFDQTAEVGERVADAVLDAVAGGVEMLSAVPLRITRTDVWLPTRADAITEQPQRTYIEPLLLAAGLPKLATPLVEPLLRQRYPWRPTLEARNGRWAVPMRVNAVRIGDLGLVTFAAETFTEIGLAAKAASPATRTLFASVADGCVSYLATAEAHAEGGYEVDVAPWAYRYPARLAPEGAQLALDVTASAIAALVMALGRRNPTGELLHHADHGCQGQYTSVEFTNRLSDWGLAGSYGSVGDCFDNAAMEAFWATLKKEIRHIWGPIDAFTRSEMRTILFDYIEVFYNRSRHQVGLEDHTPAETYAAGRAA